jgi:predicted component of type VI protein secretion system
MGNVMSQHTDVSQVFNTFSNLLSELEAFADVSNLKLAFDRERNVYLLGSNFQEQLHANLSSWREVKAELSQIIAKYCPRVPTQVTDQSDHSK